MESNKIKIFETSKDKFFIIAAASLICGILVFRFGLTENLIEYALLLTLLLIISLIDFKTNEIPDKLNLLCGAAGLFFAFCHVIVSNKSPFSYIFGFLIGGGLFLLIAIITNAMGGGDIKLMAALGLWLGLKAIICIAFLSFLVGGIVSVVLLLLKVKKRKDYIPFGPFISFAAFLTVYTGTDFWESIFCFYFF